MVDQQYFLLIGMSRRNDSRQPQNTVLTQFLASAALAGAITSGTFIGCARSSKEGRFRVQIEPAENSLQPIVSIFTHENEEFRGSVSALIAHSAKHLQPKKGRPPKINFRSWETSLGVFQDSRDDKKWTRFADIVENNNDVVPDAALRDLSSDGSEGETRKATSKSRSRRSENRFKGQKEARLRREGEISPSFPSIGAFIDVRNATKLNNEDGWRRGKVLKIGDTSNPEKRKVQVRALQHRDIKYF